MTSRALTQARRQRAQTRQAYEKYPYPAANRTALTTKGWSLAPMEWIMALWRPGDEAQLPRRIMVAGCGTGSEAFMLARKFPGAAIVAVDFSPRSIAIAKKLQRGASRMRNIRFLRGDLTDRQLLNATGGKFDFISCHGVLSYIPEPGPVLKNLERQLNADGALFLGVNGTQHFSVFGRPFLSSFHFNIGELQEEKRLRKFMALWDALLKSEGTGQLPTRGTGYLAGDLFGPTISNWSLSKWTATARKAGLELCDSYSCWRKRRALMENENASVFIPRSRAQVSLLLDLLEPQNFHRLLFLKRKPWNPRWQNHDELLRCRPARSSLYTISCRKRRAGLRTALLKSRPLNTRLDWNMPAWEAEILARSDGRRTLGEILKSAGVRAPQKVLREQLYIMQQLLVLTLLRPPNE